jgi:hypothetical protein
MPDPFLTDRVNSLAQSLVKELQSIMVEQDRTIGGPNYAHYLAIRPILTGLPAPSALGALMSTMAEILALSSNSWDEAHNAAERCTKLLHETLEQVWNIKVQREKNSE